MFEHWTIKKQLAGFTVLTIVFPIFIFYYTAYIYVSDQVAESQKNYLQTAMKVVHGSMNHRMLEMERVSKFVANSRNFIGSVERNNKDFLRMMINDLQTTCDYLDLIIVMDINKNVLVTSNKDIKERLTWDKNELLDKVIQSGKSITTGETIYLEDVLEKNSPTYEKFLVRIHANTEKEKLFSKAFIGMVAVPIINSYNDVVGVLIVSDITNNDNYFPKQYTDVIEKSFLAVSVDGIRVMSNIRSGNDEHNYVGTPMPYDIKSWLDNYHFGIVRVGSERHVFLDEGIRNYEGKVVAVLGVGIPEQILSTIVTNRYVEITIVAFFSLVVMLLLASIFAQSITNPITNIAELAKRIANGERDVVLSKQYGFATGKENMILINTFLFLLEQIKKKEVDIDNYIMQLRDLNSDLELKVATRTLALQDTMNELVRADKVKSEFLANMSHELRTPLSVIISSVELLSQDFFGELNSKQRKYANNIFKSANSLLKLINDILDLSKINSGKMNLSLSKFNICELGQQVFEESKSLLGEKKIELIFVCNNNDIFICADSIKMKQIFYNLLSNAIKFTDQGTITITIFTENNFCKMLFSDTGIGVAESDLARVFLEFEQINTSYDRKYPGTGLGLPLTKKLVEMHNGKISIKSTLGVGTEILCIIPMECEDTSDKNFNCRRQPAK